ncbi:MAG TPA: S8 family serine peptidase, partial [Blastocatellia bacterium]|nr:S8 family serine peptidase [Blastocatellia bacterium]
MFSLFRLFFSRLSLIFILTFGLVCGPLLVPAPVRAESRKPIGAQRASVPITAKHRPGELIVKFREGVPLWQQELITLAFGRSEKPIRGHHRLRRLTVKDGNDLSRAMEELNELDSLIEYAEPNYLVTRAGDVGRTPPAPNDPKFPEQWALANTGQRGGAEGADIGALAGWQQTTGSRATIIAVIDTGIDPGHPDLIHNLWLNREEAEGREGVDDDHNGYLDDLAGWNFVDDSSAIDDDHGHGTAMAGIIAAEADNGGGLSGVMWRARLMPLKALDRSGTGAISEVVEAIDYAAAQGASVINCSFGTEGYSQSLLDAIDRAAASGALVVASAGNQGADLAHTPYYPASYNLGNLIAVAASTNTDQLAEFSNWGADNVQIAAPGVEIVTTSAGGGYLRLTGTSAAAPLVAGVAGLLKTLRGWVSAQTVKQSLIDGARRSNSLSGRVSSGGLLSAGNAIAAMMSSLAGPTAGSGGEQSGTKGGASGRIDLDQLRLNRPGRAEPRGAVNLPPEGWTPPDRP